MATAQEIGERIKAARMARGLGVKNAAEATGIARDTWYRIEAGKPGQDTKRHTALNFLGLNADGLPDETTESAGPVSPDTLDARLANLDRQIDALWQRVEVLERQGDVTATAELTAEPEVIETDDLAARRRSPERSMPAPPENAAAHDPGRPSQYEREVQKQDEGYEINQDPPDIR